MNIFSLSVTDVARPVQLGQRPREGLALSPHRHVLLFPPSQRATCKREHAPWGFLRTGFHDARCRRVASARRTWGFGWTRRWSTLRTRRRSKLASSSSMRAARRQHSPRRSTGSRAWIWNIATTFADEGSWPDNSAPWYRVCSLFGLTTSRSTGLWACGCSLVGPVQYPIPKEMIVTSRCQAGCT